MRSVSKWVAIFVLPVLAGCAAHQAPPVAPAATRELAPAVAPPTTRQAELPREATLTIDQIEPRVTLAAPASAPADTFPPIEAVALYAKARAALLDDDRPAAITFLEKAVAADPHSYQLHYELARAYQKGTGADDRSIAELTKAADIEPDHLELQLSLGRQLLERGDVGAGLLHLRQAEQTQQYRAEDSRDPIVDFFLGSALARAGYDTAALESYRRLMARLESPHMAMRINRESDLLLEHIDELRVEMADLLLRLRRLEEAKAAYATAIEREPGSFELRQHQVRSLLAGGFPSAAEQAAIDAIVRFHADAQSIALLRETYSAGAKSGSVADSLARAYRNRPNDRAILYALADLLCQERRQPEAQRLLKEGASGHPDDVLILRRRVHILRQKGDLDSAARLLIGVSFQYPDLNEEIGAFWSDLTRPSRGGRLQLEQLRTLKIPQDQEPARLLWLSRIARTWHRDDKAQKALEKAVQSSRIYAPAFREMLETIWGTSDQSAEQKAAASSKLIDKVIQRGDNTLAVELRGLSLLQQAKPKEAAEALAQAMKLGDKSVEAILARADALRDSGDASGFESLLWKLISDHPTLSLSYLKLYAFYLRQDSQPKADRVLSQWFAADPQNATALEIQARDEFSAGRIGPTDSILSRLLSEDGDDPEVLASLHQFYAQMKRGSEFMGKLEARHAQEPDNWAVTIVLCQLYAELGRPADALHVADAARLSLAGDADALYILAGLYSQIDQKQKSEQVLAEVLRIDPTHAAACNDLGFSWAEQEINLDEAEKLVRRAVQSEPHNVSFLDSMGWVLYKLGRFQEAKSYLDRAVGEPMPAADVDPVVLDHRGDVQYRLGDRAAASTDWTRAIERIENLKSERDDLKELRLHLTAKQQQLQSGQPVSVAPASKGSSTH